MLDSLKMWLIQVGIKKMGPSLIRAALAWVVALIAAHEGLLAAFGIVYDKVAHTLTLHVDTLESWLLGVGLGLITASLAAAGHHAGETVKKAVTPPQEAPSDQPK